jgi:hypothetical protein
MANGRPVSSSPPEGQELERLVVAIRTSANVIFAGMVLVALALVFLAFRTTAAEGAGEALLSRELHYFVMVAVVAIYLYVQRVR